MRLMAELASLSAAAYYSNVTSAVVGEGVLRPDGAECQARLAQGCGERRSVRLEVDRGRDEDDHGGGRR